MEECTGQNFVASRILTKGTHLCNQHSLSLTFLPKKPFSCSLKVTTTLNFTIIYYFVFLKYILLILLLQQYHLPPVANLFPVPPSLQHSPLCFMSMVGAYKFFGFSTSYTLLNLPLFCSYQLCFLIPAPFPSFSLFPLCWEPPCLVSEAETPHG